MTDSFFPVGSFAYSDGLEAAVSSGAVHDGATLAEWMDHFVENVFACSEGLALARSMQALRHGDFETLTTLDAELTALRPARAVRLSSSSVGKRLLAMYAALCGNLRFSEQAARLPAGNAAVAFALVYFHSGLSEQDALLAYGYNRLTGNISAALRLMSLGHQQGQVLLSRALEKLPAAVDRTLAAARNGEPLYSFNPLLDMQQMNHQFVYSRLFRS